jgi:hypothetical protein
MFGAVVVVDISIDILYTIPTYKYWSAFSFIEYFSGVIISCSCGTVVYVTSTVLAYFKVAVWTYDVVCD